MDDNKNFEMSQNDRTFNIQDYMTKGVERIVADAVKATLKNPRKSAFMAMYCN